jgi:uncharacterized protein YebE (UPF0316 family)
MEILNFDSSLVQWVVFPLLIMLARIIDVSIGTIRIIMVARGYKLLAPVLGFFEVVIWLLAISQVMKNLHNALSYFAYGLGFALGNYVGIIIESKLAMGMQAVRIITNSQLHALPMILNEEGFGVTTMNARGSKGPVNIFFTIVPRKKVPRVLELTQLFAPKSFVTVEDVRNHFEGIFPRKTSEMAFERLPKKK